MNIREIRNYLINDSYNINISNNSLYINNYNQVDTINDKTIIILFNNFKLSIKGTNIKVKKMINKELLFNGQIESINIIYN